MHYLFLKARSLFLKNQKESRVKSIRGEQMFQEDKDKDFRLPVPL